jgi:hypothetical protein
MTAQNHNEQAFVICMEIRDIIYMFNTDDYYSFPGPTTRIFSTEDEATAETVRLLFQCTTPNTKIYVHPVSRSQYLHWGVTQ